MPGRAAPQLLELVARLGAAGPLHILDGGNCFNAYTVARALGGYTQDLQAALKRIWVARAFTCYQMHTLLEQTKVVGASVLVLDLLDTFLDQSVALDERRRLLARSIAELRRLGRAAPLAVSTRLPKPGQVEARPLLEMLERAADRVWWVGAEQPPAQPRLF